MADPNHPRKFTEEFRQQIVQLYLAGKPRRELMGEYDLRLRSPVGSGTTARPASPPGRGQDPEDERLPELEREQEASHGVDVLKQAALIFAQ